MRTLTAALLYPGIGLLETTNLSVGRGTDTPFEIVGAPWIDAGRLARHLQEAKLPGVTFVPVQFTPDSSKFAGLECSGVQIFLTNRDRFDSLRTGLTFAVALRKLHPEEWNRERYMRLLGNRQVFTEVQNGASPRQIINNYQTGLEDFKRRSRDYLLYK